MASSTPACSSTHCGSESLWSANASRGVVFTGDREAEIRTLPDPCPGSGKVVIATQASGLRGGDLGHCRVAKADRGDHEGYLICPACTGIHRFTLGEADAACRLFDAGGTGKVCFTRD